MSNITKPTITKEMMIEGKKLVRVTVKDEGSFVVIADSFCISESATGYTLYSSVDCKGQGDTDAHWAAFDDAIPSGKQFHVFASIPGVTYKCVGNEGEIIVTYRV